MNLIPVILCIGTDRVTGDCLGPLVGDILKNDLNVNAYVYGCLKSPVTALNLAETADFIKAKHAGASVIAVDSSVGKKEDIGKIRIFDGGLCPGLGVDKDLPKVGDVSITAIAAEYDGEEGANLNGVRLAFVYALAKQIARVIHASLI